MLLEPAYAENIIVGVVYNNVWNWYVTEKDVWFLDYNKLDEAYKAKGFQLDDFIDESERGGIQVLNYNNALEFLQRIKKYKVTTEELNHLMHEIFQHNATDDLLDFSPSLLIDFDKRKLYSMYPEPASYEEYVPNHWIGIYEDFTNLVPTNQKYWINHKGKSLFSER
ncbi:hypothetical protein P8884_15290 [Bacillus haynesii]|nr:hypothetical protein [Bacillus haynesii]